MADGEHRYDPALLRAARRLRGWTQQRLAEAVGASQPAISMLESGVAGCLAEEKIATVQELLAPELEALARAEPCERGLGEALLWFCPNPRCVANVPCEAGGEVWMAPSMVRAAEPQRCTWCGSVLLARCPHCGETVVEGAFCRNRACGGALVQPPADAPRGEGARRFAERERARIREIRLLTQAQERPSVGGGRRRGGA